MKRKNVEIRGHGLERHQLVEIDVLYLPKKIRKVFGIAKDKREVLFFKMLGFKHEDGNIYSRFFPVKK